jgi:hypothetical protein
MEEFDANKDCITGDEIPVKYVLEAALEQPFDGVRTPDRCWDDHAALAVLKDFSWRNGIGRVLKDCDMETRISLTERVSEIICAVVNPVVVGLRSDLGKAEAQAEELESEVSRLSLELQEQTQRRIDRPSLREDECLIRALKVSRDHIRSLWDEAKADLVREKEKLEQAETRIAELEYQLADAKAEPVTAELSSTENVKADLSIAPMVQVSEIIPPDGRVGGREGPVTITTTGTDVVKTLDMHQRAVAVYGLEFVVVPPESEAA